MKPIYRNLTIAFCMLAASSAAMALRPTHRIADDGPKLELEKIIPTAFGEWTELPLQTGQIINPQQKEMLDRIYTQTLSRTYVNKNGEYIMLSIAYGADQGDAKQLHYPEVCYPAQGFQVISNVTGEVKTDFGDIRVRRLLTVLGNRSEPLTYWTTVGNKVVVGGKETKLEQLKYGFQGQIPDGLLFRVSSVTGDTAQAYENQVDFVRQLLNTVAPGERLKLAGFSNRN